MSFSTVREQWAKLAAPATPIRWIGTYYHPGLGEHAGHPASARFSVAPEVEALFPKACGFRNGQVTLNFKRTDVTGASNETALRKLKKITEVARKNNLAFEDIFDVTKDRYATPEEMISAVEAQA